MATPENPAGTLPGKAHSDVCRPKWLAARSAEASVDMELMRTTDARA